MARRSTSRTGNFQPGIAPEDLRILQEFTNTVDLEKETDELSSPEALAEWLVRHRLCEADAVIDEAAWQMALELRRLLRRQFRLHHGRSAKDVPLGRLGRALGQAPVRLSLTDDSEVRFEAMEPGWLGVPARFLVVVTRAIQSKRWTRFKACHSETCQWIFYDGSRNRTAKWCSVQRCGNWVNTAKYRRRGPAYRRK